MTIGRTGFALVAILSLSACGGDGKMMRVTSDSNSPDEFAILPGKPLEIPKGTMSVAALPAPTPGGANRTDPQPQAEAIAALGGNASAVTAGSSAADAAILAQTGRYGVQPEIRTELAVADADFRARNPGLLLERVFKKTTYYKSYEDFELDQQTEIRRWESAGAITPGAPPDQSVVEGSVNTR